MLNSLGDGEIVSVYWRPMVVALVWAGTTETGGKGAFAMCHDLARRCDFPLGDLYGPLLPFLEPSWTSHCRKRGQELDYTKIGGGTHIGGGGRRGLAMGDAGALGAAVAAGSRWRAACGSRRPRQSWSREPRSRLYLVGALDAAHVRRTSRPLLSSRCLRA